MKYKVLALAMSLLITGKAMAADSLSELREVTSKSWSSCSYSAVIAGTVFGSLEYFDKTVSCVSNDKEKALPLYKAAVSSTKKQALKDSLKNYYVKWSSSMQSLDSLQRQPKNTIEATKTDFQQKINEAWELVELEK
jgi:hypothetical protein